VRETTAALQWTSPKNKDFTTARQLPGNYKDFWSTQFRMTMKITINSKHHHLSPTVFIDHDCCIAPAPRNSKQWKGLLPPMATHRGAWSIRDAHIHTWVGSVAILHVHAPNTAWTGCEPHKYMYHEYEGTTTVLRCLSEACPLPNKSIRRPPGTAFPRLQCLCFLNSRSKQISTYLSFRHQNTLRRTLLINHFSLGKSH
jgi:hypothetical protein